MSRRGQIPDLSAPFADKKYAVGICWSTSRNGYALLVPFAGTRSQKALSPGLWQGTVRNRKVFERKTEGTKERKKITSSQEMVKRRENRHVQHAENIRSARPRATKKQRRRVITPTRSRATRQRMRVQSDASRPLRVEHHPLKSGGILLIESGQFRR